MKMTYFRGLLKKKGYEVGDLLFNEERDVFEIMVKTADDEKDVLFSTGNTEKSRRSVKIGRGLIYSKDFQKLLVLSRKLEDHDHPPFHITAADKDTDEAHTVSDRRDLMEYFIETGKKGLSIQRYKGLGEMNPEQLWNTTMNPDKRNLLRVGIEDAVTADEIFTVLMGDEVEPRREFIQNNALEVSMLDI
jgi:DNA gyrase subunit B